MVNPRIRSCKSQLKDFHLTIFPIEKEFPLAYSILIYRDVEQIYRLLQAIYRPHNYYCIHVDRKSPEVIFDTVKSWTTCMPNLIIPDGRDRIEVNWGRMSTLQSDLTCLKLLSQNVKWKYFINLTGQDFPLKTNVEIVSILQSLNGSNDVDISFYLNKPITVGYSEESISHTKVDKPPQGLKIYKGSAHVVLSRAYTDYIVANGEFVRKFLYWLRDVNCADELFHQTLNNNPQLKIPSSSTRVNVTTSEISRLKNWGSLPCHGEWLRNICLWSPKDFDYITAPDKCHIFVNKFVMSKNGETYNMLVGWFQQRTQYVYNGDLSHKIFKNCRKPKFYVKFS